MPAIILMDLFDVMGKFDMAKAHEGHDQQLDQTIRTFGLFCYFRYPTLQLSSLHAQSACSILGPKAFRKVLQDSRFLFIFFWWRCILFRFNLFVNSPLHFLNKQKNTISSPLDSGSIIVIGVVVLIV